MRLSLSMIVRDEQRTVGRVLAQAAEFCDELVVVDTGSTDETTAIARAAGARVLDFEWVDDFGAARQCSLEACTGDWVIWLDADDVVPASVRAALRQAKADLLDDELDCVSMPYRYHFDPGDDRCTFSFPRERLVRRVPGLRWAGVVHEVLSVPGGRRVHREDLFVEHRPLPELGARKAGRNLAILERAVRAGDRSARTLLYYANELRDNGRHDDAARAYREYLTASGAGWEEYAARVWLGSCVSLAGDRDEARQVWLDAVRCDPTRAEAFMALGRLHYDACEWAQAIPFFAAAASATRPADGFVQEADYSWAPLDFLGVCLAHAGRHDEALDATLRAMRAGNPDGERLRKNLHWILDQL